MTAEEEEYAFGPFRLDAVREQLWRGNEEIRLAPKVFAVLRYLVERRGEIVSKNALLDSIWQDLHVTDTVLAVHVGKAREALGDDPKQPEFIETVHRRGYRFIAACTESRQTPLSHADSRDQPAVPVASEPATTLGTKPLVGRKTELSFLREQLNAAVKGRGSLVFITGPAGIGKTRLTLEVRDWASASGCQWLEGRYDKVVRHPYQAWVETIRRHLQRSGSPSLENLGASYGGQLSKLVPEIETAEIPSNSSRSDPEAERLKLFDAIVGFFLGISQQSPLVLCINDLHWAGSIELVHYLARRIGNKPILILATYRDDELKNNTGLWETVLAMNRERLFHTLPLEALGASEVETLIASTFDKPVAARLADSVHRKTEGNPFFVEEVLYLLQERRLLYVSDTGWQVTDLDALETPESVKAVINQRMERLRKDTRELLRIASVVGRKFPLQLLTELAGQEEDSIVDALDEGNGANVVFPIQAVGEEIYSFVHDLTQETLYESIGPARRRRYHKRIGEAIEKLHADGLAEHYSELAHHYSLSDNVEKAVHYRTLAGEQAIQRSAHADAISHLTTALELLKTLPDTPERASHELTLLIGLGVPLIAMRGHGVPEVKKVYMRARELCLELGEASQVLAALPGLVRFHMNQADLRTAREIAEQLMSLAMRKKDPTSIMLAHRMLGRISFHMGELASALTWMEKERALDNAQRPHGFVAFAIDPKVQNLATESLILWKVGYPEKAVAIAEEALSLAQKLSHPYTLAYAKRDRMVLHQHRREVQATSEWANTLISLCNDEDMPHFLAFGIITRGWALTQGGECEEGLAQIHEGFAIRAAAGSLLHHPYLLGLRAEAQGTAGQIEEGLNTLAEALHRVNETGEHQWESDLLTMRGELLAKSKIQGAQSEAESCLRRAVDVARRQGARSYELRATTSLSRLLRDQDRNDEARKILAEIYGWFTEGFDTADLRKAKLLLDELS